MRYFLYRADGVKRDSRRRYQRATGLKTHLWHFNIIFLAISLDYVCNIRDSLGIGDFGVVLGISYAKTSAEIKLFYGKITFILYLGNEFFGYDSKAQATILKWLAYSFSRESSQPRIEPGSPALQVDSLPTELPWKPKNGCMLYHSRDNTII